MAAVSWSGIFARFLVALLLVMLSYNPTGYSYYHWVSQSVDAINPYIAIAGILLVIGWVIFLRATMRSLGFLGILLVGLLFGCVIWLLIDLGLLALEESTVFHWIVLVLIAVVLAIGMSWSHIRRRISGQVDVIDDDDEKG